MQGKTDPKAVVTFILNFLVKHNSPAEPSATAAQVAATGAAWQPDDGKCYLHWTFGALGRHALEAADASAARWRAGKPLSVLDGVPFAVKDHMPAVGFQAPAGTRFPKCARDIDSTARRSGTTPASTHLGPPYAAATACIVRCARAACTTISSVHHNQPRAPQSAAPPDISRAGRMPQPVLAKPSAGARTRADRLPPSTRCNIYINLYSWCEHPLNL